MPTVAAMKQFLRAYYRHPDVADEPLVIAYINRLEDRGIEIQRGPRGGTQFIYKEKIIKWEGQPEKANGQKLWFDLYKGLVWE